MAVVQMLSFVLLLCLSMVVEVESQILHGEQSLTEIADDDDHSPDTTINPHQATMKAGKNVPPVFQRKNAVPRSLKREQFSVEMVDESAQRKKTISSANVGNSMKNFGFLSKEETALVDQDVDKVLDYYGFGMKNGPKKEIQKGSRIKEPNVMAEKSVLMKNRVLNSVGKSLKQKPQIPIQRAQHTMDFKTSSKAKMRGAHVLNKNPKFILSGRAQKLQVLQARSKKMPDIKRPTIINKKGSSKTQEMHPLKGAKNRLDLSQPKNVIHYSPLQENNGKLFTQKHQFDKDSGHQPGWLSVKDKINFYQDEASQNPEPNMNPNVAKAAQDYMKMTNKDILKLVENDQQKNGLNTSRGGVDIAAPDWLPIKDKIHGMQFDVIQDDKMGPNAMPGGQNGMTGANGNGQPSRVSGVQNGMAQRQQNGQPSRVSGVQNGMAQRQQNGQPSRVSGVQNGMAQRQQNGQPSRVSGVQNGMAQRQQNGQPSRVSGVQNGMAQRQQNGQPSRVSGVQNGMAQRQQNGQPSRVSGVQNGMAQRQQNGQPSRVSGVQNGMAQRQQNGQPSRVSGVQNDMAQRQQNGQPSRVSGVQNDMAQRQQNGQPSRVSGVQNDMAQRQQNGQPSRVSGVQNGMAQRQQNGQPSRVSGVQNGMAQRQQNGQPSRVSGVQNGMAQRQQNGQPSRVSGVQNGMAQRQQNGQPSRVSGVQNGMAQRQQNGQPSRVSGVQNGMAQRQQNGQPSRVSGVQNGMAQRQQNGQPSRVSGVQNGMAQRQQNGQPSRVSGVQNDMAQTQTNGEKIPNNVNDKQKNKWLPINDNFLNPDVQFEISRDGINSSNQIKKNTKMMNKSLSSELTEVEGLNATASSEFGNITANDNITSKATNLEDSAGNSEHQYISFKTNQNETLSNNSEVENILSGDQNKLNLTSLANKDSNSNFKQLQNEKDVSKQVWSPGKVLHSHGHEVLRMTSWSPWSTCSETCGTNGLQIRTRKCMHAQNEDLPCNGSTIDWKWCASVDVCPESGLHIASHDNNSTFVNVVIEPNTSPSKWGSWSACSKRCGTKSLRIRTRNCPGQRSKDTGVCVEPTMQWTWCQSIPCREPQNAAMKVSNQKRGKPSASGTILGPPQANSTTHPVIHTDDGIAFQDNCVVSSWSKWSKCSKSCGENSFKFRTRTCNCGYKQLCKSPTLQREHCRLKPCEGEENYGPWSSFSPCTKSCGGGWKKRTRRCKKDSKGRHLCDQDLLIGVKVCNIHTCQNVLNKDSMVANVNPKSMCGFNPCAEFGCMDNPDSKCLADRNCDPVFFNSVGQIDEKCRGWQRYEVKNPSLFCGFDPCYGSKCQRAFGRCLVDLNCKAFVLGADGTEINCNRIQYPF